jgi:valyl-tRNA synthetase
VPFITEEIYSNVPGVNESIMVSSFPRYNAKFNYSKAVKDIEPIMAIIKAVRFTKAKTGAAPSKKVQLFVKTDLENAIKKGSVYIEKLAGVSSITLIKDKTELTSKSISQVLDFGELYIPMGELVDYTQELARLKGELNTTENEIKRASGKLNNQGFLAKAPKSLVDTERAKLDKFIDMRNKLKKEIAELEQEV